MKKLILSFGAILFCFGASFAQNHYDKLPKNTQDFIAKNFSGEKVRSAEEEKDFLNFGNGEMYEVVLENGIKLDFNKAGEVTEIDSKKGVAIPESSLPGPIYAYVEKNYPGMHITNWEMDRNNQEVELSDGTDLEFDRDGKFLKVD